MTLSSFFDKNKNYIFILLIAGFVVYVNCLGNKFVWDDEEMVVNNFPYFTLGNLPSLFRQATFYAGGSSLGGWFYRPLVMVSFLLIKVFLGNSSFGYHLAQISLHLINTILVFWIFSYLFARVNKIYSQLVGFLFALIFLVHPGLVEAVSYIASMAEPLYTLFILVFFVLLIKSGEEDFSYKQKFLAALFLILALLTKEGAIVFVPLSLLYSYLFQRKSFGSWIRISLGSFLAYVCIRLTFFGIQNETPHFLAPLAQAPLYNKLLTSPYIIFSFLRAFFAPITLSISQHEVVRNPNWSNFGLPVLVITLFFFMVSILLIKTKSKLGLFFALWFVLGIVPTISVVFPLDMTFAERWLYFPSIGMLGFLGVLVLSMPNMKNIIPILLWLGIIGAVLFGIRTIIRNNNWKDGLALYAHDIVYEPKSFDLQNNLGVELVRKGQWDLALPHIQRSVELEPKWTISTNNLGAVYEHFGEISKAEEYYKKSITLGDYYLAYENYALILVKEKRNDEAKKFLEMSAFPKYPNNERLTQIYLYIQNQSKN